MTRSHSLISVRFFSHSNARSRLSTQVFSCRVSFRPDESAVCLTRYAVCAAQYAGATEKRRPWRLPIKSYFDKCLLDGPSGKDKVLPSTPMGGPTAYWVRKPADSLRQTADSDLAPAYSLRQTADSDLAPAYSLRQTADSSRTAAYRAKQTAYSTQRQRSSGIILPRGRAHRQGNPRNRA